MWGPEGKDEVNVSVGERGTFGVPDVAGPAKTPGVLVPISRGGRSRTPSWTWDEGQEWAGAAWGGDLRGVWMDGAVTRTSLVPGWLWENVYVAGSSALVFLSRSFRSCGDNEAFLAEDAISVLDASYPLHSQPQITAI